MMPYNMHTLDDTSHPAKIEPALPIQAAEKKQTGSDIFFAFTDGLCSLKTDDMVGFFSPRS